MCFLVKWMPPALFHSNGCVYFLCCHCSANLLHASENPLVDASFPFTFVCSHPTTPCHVTQFSPPTMVGERTVSGGWKPDSSAPVCDSCDVTFTVYRRRHHCRCCGGVFCNSCSNTYVSIPALHEMKPQRVCRACATALSGATDASATAGSAATDPVSGGSFPSIAEEEEEGGDGIVSSGSSRLDDDSGDVDDSSSHSGDVSSAVAAVYSSVEEGPRTSSMTFIAALQENLRHSDDPGVVTILMYASATRQQLILVTVSDGETMSMLAERLADTYLRLENGPFKAASLTDRENALKRLRFFSESAAVDNGAQAVSVALQHRRLVLTGCSLSELQCQSAKPLVHDFFCSNISAGECGEWE